MVLVLLPWGGGSHEGNGFLGIMGGKQQDDDSVVAAERAVRAIAGQLDVAMGSESRIARELEWLDATLRRGASNTTALVAKELLPRLGKRRSSVAQRIFELLETHVLQFERPLRIVLGMLSMRDTKLQRRAIELSRRVAEATEHDDPEAVELIITHCDPIPELVNHPPSVEALGTLLGADGGPMAALVGVSPARRRLSARVLDLRGLPSHEVASAVLGEAHATELRALLEYTRATHLDLVRLTPEGARRVPCLASLRRVRSLLGPQALASLVGELGWARVCWGMAAQRFAGVSVEGQLPYRIDHDLAPLLESGGSSRREWERTIVVVEGDDGLGERATGSAQVRTFRSYNVRHAELLEAFLEIAPLTRAKAERILRDMADIVADFEALFGDHTTDGAIAHEKYRQLRQAIVAALEGDDTALQSSETARLVQMFEEPRSVEEVTTLHGLKRYLHQRGLRLAFRLFKAGTANRTVDLIVLDGDQSPRIVAGLRYVDFEPERRRFDPGPPLAVSLITEAFTAYLLHGGQARLPAVEVLSYGNEVQIYLHYVNHPAFLRLDLSPPRNGGMLDLEYFGVSQYELQEHPDLELPAIRRLLQTLDFDVECDGLRLRVRYDKERARGVEDLIDHVRYLLTLVPHLMDLDWIVGGLDYSSGARELLVDGWATFVTHHLVLPVDLLLTSDRHKVLRGAQPTPVGLEELCWDGSAPYGDRFSGCAVGSLRDRLETALHARGLEHLAAWGETRDRPGGQLLLERVAVYPLREAIARGELRIDPQGAFVLADRNLFQREHEVVRLARIVAAGGEALVRGLRLARLVPRLSRFVQFHHSGAIQGRAVERGLLRLGRSHIGVFLIRDVEGRPRLALATKGVLFRKRQSTQDPWRDSEDLDPAHIADALQLSAEREAVDTIGVPESWDPHHHELSTPSPVPVASAEEGAGTWPGVVAVPGRASGFARFVSHRMTARDAADAVLVARAFCPDDAPLIARSAALLSTGGGVLSHAGVTALELGKPALVVDAVLSGEAGGHKPHLGRRNVRYADEHTEVQGLAVVIKREVGEAVETIEEGDLLVIDGYRSNVTNLGQQPEALALFRELNGLDTAAVSAERASDQQAVLVARGQLLRCAHQLNRLLAHLAAAPVARFAVRALVVPRDSADAHPVWPSAGLKERARLLATLLANSTCGEVASRELARIDAVMRRELQQLTREAHGTLPLATNVFQVAYPWLQALRVDQAVEQMDRLLDVTSPQKDDTVLDLSKAAISRLRVIHRQLVHRLAASLDRDDQLWRVRHVQRAIEQTASVLEVAALPSPLANQADEALGRHDRDLRERAASQYVLSDSQGGVALAPLIGSKAAHLGEISRMLPRGAVPRWFAVTDRALHDTLDHPVRKGVRLGAAIREVLAQEKITPGRKAKEIFQLWHQTALPSAVRSAIVEAYRELGSGDEHVSVAVRSSAFEEDSERQAWAGQFATYLGVRGEAAVLEHVRLTWAALWSKPVLIRRRQLGLDDVPRVGAGIVLQRMVASRASGVLFTASPAAHPREMLINVGLGLGEGVVSGAAEVDHIVVQRDHRHERPLELKYTVGDKRHRIVLAARAEQRTRLEEVPYHQRLRPALEFVEIQELVQAALRIEATFLHPIDIEFAFEGPQLHILQARPVPAFHASLANPLLSDAVANSLNREKKT